MEFHQNWQVYTLGHVDQMIKFGRSKFKVTRGQWKLQIVVI